MELAMNPVIERIEPVKGAQPAKESCPAGPIGKGQADQEQRRARTRNPWKRQR